MERRKLAPHDSISPYRKPDVLEQEAVPSSFEGLSPRLLIGAAHMRGMVDAETGQKLSGEWLDEMERQFTRQAEELAQVRAREAYYEGVERGAAETYERLLSYLSPSDPTHLKAEASNKEQTHD